MVRLLRERVARELGEDDVHVMLSHLCQLKGDWEGALEAMEKALEIRGDLACFDRVLEGILFGDASEPSVRAYRELLSAGSDHPELHYRLGLVLAGNGLPEAAAVEFANAVAVDGRREVARLDRRGRAPR